LGFLVHESLVGITGEVEPAPILETGSIVGRGATVVGGVRVGEFAVVGAGAIVRKDIEPYAIVAGNPARIVGHRAAKDIERVKERIQQGHYL
jgi:acetyltransferase-like isoleucine patch superfamily enzyme